MLKAITIPKNHTISESLDSLFGRRSGISCSMSRRMLTRFILARICHLVFEHLNELIEGARNDCTSGRPDPCVRGQLLQSDV